MDARPHAHGDCFFIKAMSTERAVSASPHHARVRHGDSSNKFCTAADPSAYVKLQHRGLVLRNVEHNEARECVRAGKSAFASHSWTFCAASRRRTQLNNARHGKHGFRAISRQCPSFGVVVLRTLVKDMLSCAPPARLRCVPSRRSCVQRARLCPERARPHRVLRCSGSTSQARARGRQAQHHDVPSSAVWAKHRST